MFKIGEENAVEVYKSYVFVVLYSIWKKLFEKLLNMTKANKIALKETLRT